MYNNVPWTRTVKRLHQTYSAFVCHLLCGGQGPLFLQEFFSRLYFVGSLYEGFSDTGVPYMNSPFSYCPNPKKQQNHLFICLKTPQERNQNAFRTYRVISL